MTLDEAILAAIHNNLSKIQIGLPGVIESFKPEEMTANVRIPFKKEDENGQAKTFPVLSGIRVGTYWAGDFYIKPDYKRGDKVWVSFSTHDISDAIRGVESVTSDSLFDLQSACVVSGYKGKTDLPASTSNLAGLVIGHKEGRSLIQLDGDRIKIQGGAVDLSEYAVLGETLVDFIKSLIDVFLNNAASFTTNTVPSSPAGLAAVIISQLNIKKTEAEQILSGKVKLG
ncbi:Gp138 family membrane-puncturing spike protein [Leptospira ellisii]|uniref:Gp138 family membrane-puncturing spike protein n=1 Tax=Leptospira ellisii TaxID=2023197 RepID=A0A2N0BAX1_9LEPT|nr:Gp138 family membrane-puncturing spike protein [Leptospira ellisii]MDV6235830.1 Gp138 family membrane-puncturing spike protein [Leptospira ellisii]PJZ93691.1 hypothetical protein CH379_06565 [Leptospira ellisii]PKA03769.1 hypothetical protein CH375_15040 [Leptospira ellisii]